MTDELRVLWLTPSKAENISVGRSRIAEHLLERGISVEIQEASLRNLKQLLTEKVSYDVVIGTTRAGAIFGSALRVLKRIPFIVDHVDPISQFESTNSKPLALFVRLLENVSFGLSEHTMYVYPEEGRRVKRYASDFTETNLGVEYEAFSCPGKKTLQEVRERLSELSLEDRTAIYVGGLEPMYHIMKMIDAFEHLPDWSLLVLGSGSLESAVRSRSSRMENVHFIGTVDHELVPGFLHEADVGISLVNDPRTLKVLEYGASELPTVQLDGAARERFDGLVAFTDSSPERIAQTITRADEELDPEPLREYASSLSWGRIAEDYETTIRKIV
jgi:glycosyltransferase involved in cell wall biosynthesis